MKTGILLINLGTPKEPTVKAVRSYLWQFLSDPLVIDLPWLPRMILVTLIALTRPKQSAEAYSSIWLPEGSPLLVHTKALQTAVQENLDGDYFVEIAMRYGEPSIASALKSLVNKKVDRLWVLPLFPQYSRAATGSALAEFHKEISKQKIKLPIFVKDAFFDNSAYTTGIAEWVKQGIQEIDADHVLFSYHGIPERQMHYNPNYQKDCFATSEAIATKLGLSASQYHSSFQSRLGRTPWIKPYTDELIIQLREQGIKRLAVACPSFVADCLETLEEIGLRAKEQWLALGGEKFMMVPCLNNSKTWVAGLVDLIKKESESN